MDLLSLTLTQFQLYGLIFLLGSFSVATLSDLKTMTAQREFMEVWILFVFAFLAYDVYIGYTHGAGWLLYAKWGLILLFFITWSFGLFFKTARGDAAACIAVMVLLTPPFILLFLLTLKILSMIFSPFLIFGFGDKKGYPFMPVVSFATLVTLFAALYAIGWIQARV